MISIIDETGVERWLGNLEPPAGLVRGLPVYGDVPNTPMIPRSQWDNHIIPGVLDDATLPPVADQDGIGACNASATCTAMEYIRQRQGLPYKQLSAGYLYGKINGGSDRGSMLEDGLEESMKGGTCTVETVPYLDWRKRPAAAIEEGKKYRFLECFQCPTFEHCFSCTAAGYALISGGMWYSNYNVDADGWLPTVGRGGGGGHAIFGFAPTKRGSGYGIAHQNSWRATWGRKGRMVLPESFYGRDIGGFWCGRVVVDEGGVIPIPPDNTV